MIQSWSLADVRRLYAALVTEKKPIAEVAGELRCDPDVLNTAVRALMILPRRAAPALKVIEEIWRRSVERPHFSAGEIEALKSEWVKPDASAHGVAVRLRRRLDLVRRRARALGLGRAGCSAPPPESGGRPDISESVRRAAEAVARPGACLSIAEAANSLSVPCADVRDALRAIDPDHDALSPQPTRWLGLGEDGPKLSWPELTERRLAPLRDRARRLARAGLTCPHALARELDPLREHRLTPQQAAALAEGWDA
jgi:hypothetical protein